MSGFGLGYSPFASGTVGSAGACIIALAVWAVLGRGSNPIMLNIAWALLTLLACVGCVAWGPWAVEYYAGKEKKKGDPGQVVIDEFAGQWLALIALPMASIAQAITVLAVQFFLFRFFDVAKIPPARQLEKLPRGWGVLADDLMAGIYANLVGQLVIRWFFAEMGIA
jgi:phosphatidylglycerophosphatase A